MSVRLLLLICFVATGCSRAVNVKLDNEYQFPSALISPFNTHATLVLDSELESYVAMPNKDTQIQLGASQTKMFEKVLGTLFVSSNITDNKEYIAPDQLGLVIRPKVHEVQTAIPTESQLNIFEVWVKYQLLITDNEGNPIANWLMPAYGKTPTAFMRSKEDALAQATMVALRDAAANMSLSFQRIPEVNRWMQRNDVSRVETNE